MAGCWIRFAGTLFLGLCGSMVPAPSVAEIAGFKGGDARVVVFDASGSMRNFNFEQKRTRRIEVARDVLKEVFGQLDDQNDTTPTALSVFGASEAWDDFSAQFGGDAGLVPQTHPLCRDIETVLDFSPIDSTVVARAEQIAEGINWNGMTPIHISLLQGLQAFTGSINDATLQFVLISDLDDPNCLPDGVTICDALQFELDRIKSEGGKVEAIVFETPVAAIREPLSQCMTVATHGLDLEEPDPAATVREAFDTLTLVPQLVVEGPSLDPTGIVAASARYRIASAQSGTIVASGPHGMFELPAGRYTIAVDIDSVTASATLDVDRATSVDLGLPPAVLTVEATTNGAPGPTRLSNLVIRRPGGVPVAVISDYAAGDRLALANGTYELTAQDSTGQSATATVVLVLGRAQAVTLDFGAQMATERDVLFDIEVVPPTLAVGPSPDPVIELVHPGGLREVMSRPGHSATLAPGRYEVQVSGATPHVMAFEVAAAPVPLEVQVHVTPGWFVASSTLINGRFELRDAGGAPLFSFDAQEVVHSLPEGRYLLTYVDADGQQTERGFDIRMGEETRLAPF